MPSSLPSALPILLKATVTPRRSPPPSAKRPIPRPRRADERRAEGAGGAARRRCRGPPVAAAAGAPACARGAAQHEPAGAPRGAALAPDVGDRCAGGGVLRLLVAGGADLPLPRQARLPLPAEGAEAGDPLGHRRLHALH